MTPPLPVARPTHHHELQQRADGLYKVDPASGREWRLVWRPRADDEGERWYVSEFAWVPVELLAGDGKGE